MKFRKVEGKNVKKNNVCKDIKVHQLVTLEERANLRWRHLWAMFIIIHGCVGSSYASNG